MHIALTVSKEGSYRIPRINRKQNTISFIPSQKSPFCVGVTCTGRWLYWAWSVVGGLPTHLIGSGFILLLVTECDDVMSSDYSGNQLHKKIKTNFPVTVLLLLLFEGIILCFVRI